MLPTHTAKFVIWSSCYQCYNSCCLWAIYS